MSGAALTDTAWQALVVAKLGERPESRLAGLMPSFWAQYPQYSGYRRALAVTADALTQLIGELAACLRDPDISAERVTAVRTELAIREAQQSAITSALAALRSEGPGNRVAVGGLTATAPIPSPRQRPDANGTRWRGDPNVGGWPW